MITNLSKRLVYACLLSAQLLTCSTAFAKSGGGAIAGGGGDANEDRVNEIRTDLLKWINNDGAKGLKLPSSLSYGEYVEKMTHILQPQEVVVAFVVKDDAVNEELQVSVNGVPKTCRGFISRMDSKFHILCNISRFEATSESEQYRLIHHEYAGLMNVENNEEAASDYNISSQITDYLSMQTVLRLAVKTKSSAQPGSVPKLEVVKNKYVGKGKFDIKISLQNSEDVIQLRVGGVKEYCYTTEGLGTIRNDYTISLSQEMEEEVDNICKFKRNVIAYKDMLAQLADGSLINVEPFKYNFSERISEQDGSWSDLTPKASELITFSSLIKNEIIEEGADKSEIKKRTYEVTMQVSADQLSDYRGVILDNGDEFLSEDANELAAFINSKKMVTEVKLYQFYKATGYMCNYMGRCVFNTNKKIEGKFVAKTGDYQNLVTKVRLIKKGDISVATKEVYIVKY